MPNPTDRNIFDFTIETPPNGVPGNALTFRYGGPGDAELALLQVQFDSDANVANRTVELHWDIGNGYQRLCGSNTLQTASSTGYYTAGLFGAAYATAEGSRIYMPLPPFCRSTQSIFYELNAVNLQAADQFKNLKLYWLRWIDGL